MKVGLRTPSLSKRIAARTSIRRVVRHNLGLKVPRGYGWITSPRRAAYNRVYNRTTVSVDQLARAGHRRHYHDGTGALSVFAILGAAIAALVSLLGAIAGGRRHR